MPPRFLVFVLSLPLPLLRPRRRSGAPEAEAVGASCGSPPPAGPATSSRPAVPSATPSSRSRETSGARPRVCSPSWLRATAWTTPTTTWTAGVSVRRLLRFCWGPSAGRSPRGLRNTIWTLRRVASSARPPRRPRLSPGLPTASARPQDSPCLSPKSRKLRRRRLWPRLRPRGGVGLSGQPETMHMHPRY